MRNIITIASDEQRYGIDWQNYTEEQKREIRYALKFNLPPEKMALLLDPALDAGQIGELRNALLSNMSMEQIEIFNNPEIDWHSMWELKKCIRKGVDLKLVRQMADARLRDVQIEQIRIALQGGAPLEQLAETIRAEAVQNGCH